MSAGVFCGYHLDEKTGRMGSARFYNRDRHGLVIGPTGSGKTAGFLQNNLLADNLVGESLVLIDPKGELAAVSAASRRRKRDDVFVIDPFGVLPQLIGNPPDRKYRELAAVGVLDSVGFDPLATLNVANPNFYDDCAALAEALIQSSSTESHWTDSAKGLITALLMWEVAECALKPSARRKPRLPHVRRMLTEPEQLDMNAADKKTPLSGLRFTARTIITTHQIIQEGEQRGEQHPVSGVVMEIIASLIARFVDDNREVMSIRSTADTQTRWLLSPAIAEDLSKPGLDFRRLKDRCTCVFIILPSDKLRTHAAWLRLIVVTALRRLSTPGGIRTRFFIDEMPALGYLPPLADAYAQIRGFNVCLIGIVQDLNQLKALYNDWWESFTANAGFTLCFGPNDLTTARWMSERSGQQEVLIPTVNESGSGDGMDLSKRTAGSSESYTMRPILYPHDLFAIAPGTGLYFRASHKLAALVALPLYTKNPAAKHYLDNPLES